MITHLKIRKQGLELRGCILRVCWIYLLLLKCTKSASVTIHAYDFLTLLKTLIRCYKMYLMSVFLIFVLSCNSFCFKILNRYYSSSFILIMVSIATIVAGYSINERHRKGGCPYFEITTSFLLPLM